MRNIFIGFDVRHEPLIRNAQTFKYFLEQKNNLDLKSLSLYIHYLSNGFFLTGAMSYIYDNEGLPIGNLDYYTDGKFIWPSYYVYYLKKYSDFYVDSNMYKYAKDNNFTIRAIDKNQLIILEKAFNCEWSGKY